MYPQPMYQPMYQPAMQQVVNNLISVRSEAEARNYPVEPGKSLTFKDETAPYIYTKTMGLSPLEQPKFEKFKLEKEDDEPLETDRAKYVTVDDLKAIISDVESLKDEIYGLKRKPVAKRKEVVEDDT